MRRVAVFFAILLIAACPPRRGRGVHVRPVACPAPVVVGYAVAPPPAKMPESAKPEKPVDPLVEQHLTAWEKKTTGLTNVRVEIALKRTDSVTKKESNFSGPFLFMKPNYAVLRLDNTNNPTDYEAYICNENAVYAYNGIAKTVTEFKKSSLNKAANTVEGGNPIRRWIARLYWGLQPLQQPAFQFFTGVKASDLQERFDITLFKTDENYVYLDIQPRFGKDQREFKHLRLALYGPGPNTAKVAYLPAQIYVLKPNGDTEVWKFTNPVVNVPGVEPKHFQRVEVKEPGWTYQNADGSVSEPEAPKP